MSMAVYIVKHSLVNEELRYSLRSLAQHWPDTEVTIVGFKPPWIVDVNYIPVPQVPGEKHLNSLRNQAAALSSNDLPSEYWSMNDDFFILKPGATEYHWGFVEDVIQDYGRKELGNSYYRSMIATWEICRDIGFEKPLSYAAHVPGRIHKDIMRDTVRDCNREGVWVQHLTIANNIAKSGGLQLPHGDVKIYDRHRLVKLPDWLPDSEYVSTYDVSFGRGSIGKWIRERFPEPCKFEA